MARLAVLEPDARLAVRLSTALADYHELIECADIGELLDIVMTRPLDGTVIDIYHPGHPVHISDLQRLRRRVPPLAIVVYADFQSRELDLFELGRLRVDGVILTGATDQPQQTRRAVEEALCSAAALRVTDALAGELHPLGMKCLRRAIEGAQDSPSVEHLAEASGLTSSALARELRKRQLPSPARFVYWGRLFRAASLLSDADRRTEDVAFRLSYSSASALTRALRRETGVTLGELRRRGATACVLEGFRRREAQGQAGGRP